MKKLLSIVLAAAMLAAVSVPSFAADKTLTSDHTCLLYTSDAADE